MLEVERQYLDNNRDELQKKYGGKVLVVKGESVSGAFDTIEEALQGAVAQHGLENVLIRRPSEGQIEFTAPALTLGILSADPTLSSDNSPS